MIESDSREVTPPGSPRIIATGESGELADPAPRGDAMSRAGRIAALVLLVAVGSLPFLLNVGADPDLWWQVRTGERIIDEGSVPRVDDWSFTAAGEEWTNHEWLTGVIFATAFDLGGSTGLLVVRGLLFVAMVTGLVLAYSRRVKHPLLVLLLLLVTVPILGTFINVRAHSFSYTLVVWVIVALDRIRDGHWRWLAALPALLAFWANVHGGFVLGLALVGSSLFLMLIGWDGIAARPVGRERRLIVATGLATLAATLLNPFGPWLYVYVADELSAQHVQVSEWQPITGDQLPYFWIYLIVPLVLWLLARRWRHIGLVAMLLVTAYSTYQAARFFVLMGVFGSIVAVGAGGELVRRGRASGRLHRYERLLEPRLALGSLVVLTVALAIPFLGGAVRGQAGVTVDRSLYPVEATAWLADQEVGPNLALALHYGGYAIWHLGPETKVAVDGRNVTMYDSKWIDGYLLALEEGRALEVLDESEVDAWMLPADSAQIAPLEATGRWSVAYRDEVAVVVLPGRVATPVIGPSAPRDMRFPGPTGS